MSAAIDDVDRCERAVGPRCGLMAAGSAIIGVQVSSTEVTILFTDIEGSTRLWEQQAERMARALAQHDALLRRAVEQQGGEVVKTTGDGIHAVFTDAAAAVSAGLDLQQALQDPHATNGILLKVRCGI